MKNYCLFKRLGLLFLMVFLVIPCVKAEHHALEVQRFPQWGHQYLTVTNTWNNWYLVIEGDVAPQFMDVITEVNGVTTEGMSEATFYELLNTTDLRLKFLHKQNGKTRENNCVLKDATRVFYFSGGTVPFTVDKVSDEVTFQSDAEIDFFEYDTFDFIVGKEDPLTDKNILMELAKVLEHRGLARSTKNPDLYITLSKSLSQSSKVSSQVVKEGSITGVATNIWTGQKYLVEDQKNKVVTTTNVEATFHLNLAIMDGVKYRNDAESLPIIWQLNYSKYSDNAINLMTEVKEGVTYCFYNYPFSSPKYALGFYGSGVVLREKDFSTGYIYDVIEGSGAYQRGLRAGDQLMKAYVSAHGLVPCCGVTRATFYKANSHKHRSRRFFFIYLIPFPGSAYVCPESVLTQLPLDGDGDPHKSISFGRLKYVFRHEDGQKVKITGLPCEQLSLIPCEHIYTNN